MEDLNIGLELRDAARSQTRKTAFRGIGIGFDLAKQDEDFLADAHGVSRRQSFRILDKGKKIEDTLLALVTTADRGGLILGHRDQVHIRWQFAAVAHAEKYRPGWAMRVNEPL